MGLSIAWLLTSFCLKSFSFVFVLKKFYYEITWFKRGEPNPSLNQSITPAFSVKRKVSAIAEPKNRSQNGENFCLVFSCNFELIFSSYGITVNFECVACEFYCTAGWKSELVVTNTWNTRSLRYQFWVVCNLSDLFWLYVVDCTKPSIERGHGKIAWTSNVWQCQHPKTPVTRIKLEGKSL